MSKCKNPYDECENEEECCWEEKKCCDIDKCHKRINVLQAISLVPQTVATTAAVPFDTNLVTEGFGIIHTAGSTAFTLAIPGIYKVTFTGTVTPVGTTAGVALALSNTIIPGTTVTETVTAGTAASLAAQALIEVVPFITSTITVVNPTAGTETFTNPNIIIERIG